MRHHIVENRLFAWPYNEDPKNICFLSEDQEQFLKDHPKAKVHEVRACLLDADNPEAMRKLKAEAKEQVESMASMRRNTLMPESKRDLAVVVSQLGEDGAISLQVSKDRLAYYNAVSTAIQTEKLRISRLIDGATTPEAIQEAVSSCRMNEIKTGAERF